MYIIVGNTQSGFEFSSSSVMKLGKSLSLSARLGFAVVIKPGGDAKHMSLFIFSICFLN